MIKISLNLTFFVIGFLVLLTLNCAHIITIPFWLVCMPLWIFPAAIAAIAAIVMIGMAVLSVFAVFLLGFVWLVTTIEGFF